MVTEEVIKAQLREALEECQRWKEKCKNLNEKVQEKLSKAEDVLSLKLPSSVSESVKEVVKELTITKEEVSVTCKDLAEFKGKTSSWFLSLPDQLEETAQYSRKNNAILKGFRNLPNLNDSEFIFFIADQLNYLFPSCSNFGRILPCHIDDAHPLGRTSNGRYNVIIKFVNRWLKDKIISCQNDLYGTGITVTEHLTKNTYSLLNSAQMIVGTENAWVYKCTVFAACKNRKIKIRNQRDLAILKDCQNSGVYPPGHDVAINDELSDTNNTNLNTTNINRSTHSSQYSNTSFVNSTPYPPSRGRASRYGRGGYHQNRDY